MADALILGLLVYVFWGLKDRGRSEARLRLDVKDAMSKDVNDLKDESRRLHGVLTALRSEVAGLSRSAGSNPPDTAGSRLKLPPETVHSPAVPAHARESGDDGEARPAPSVVSVSDRLRSLIDRYCRGDADLAELIGAARRDNLQWGSTSAAINGDMHLEHEDDRNPVIAFQKDLASSEFWLILQEGKSIAAAPQAFDNSPGGRSAGPIRTAEPAIAELLGSLLRVKRKGTVVSKN